MVKAKTFVNMASEPDPVSPDNERKSGLYVHIPFCRSKCPYCGFASVASSKLKERWLNAFIKEIISSKGKFKDFDSLYLGGGTPTFLDAGDLETIMTCLFNFFHFSEDSEITIEANPCDLTSKKIEKLKELGINRVSIGIQSFDDSTLSFLGRLHTAGEAQNALDGLKSAGFENIGMDLIYGLKDQTIKVWSNTLKRALEFQPEHISCYQLTFEKGTPFWSQKEKGQLMPLEEAEEGDFFLATADILKANGYIHYEVSNFARGKNFYSRHNRKYWQHIPYLGLGPSAHSFYGSSRWYNVKSVRKYCELLEKGESPIEAREDLTQEQLRIEKICLGSRTMDGFDLDLIPDTPQHIKTLSNLIKSDFLRVKNNRVIPTLKGFMVADYISFCFSE